MRQVLRNCRTLRNFDTMASHGFVIRDAGAFTAQAASGETLTAARMVITTVHRDHPFLSGLPGIVQAYGKSACPCPFCDG